MIGLKTIDENDLSRIFSETPSAGEDPLQVEGMKVIAGFSRRLATASLASVAKQSRVI